VNIYAVREEESILLFPQPELISAEKRVPAVIKVVGTGGGGCNAVNNMIDRGLCDVQFIAVNTDLQHLSDISIAETKLQIGAKVTGGMGAGGVPEKGERAANEDRERIADALRGANMVFITAGMGGGTGTGSAPVIAQIARELGALTIGVVTKPFEFEGRYRMKAAEEGINKLREVVDTLIVIPNENIFKKIDSEVDFDDCCLIADDVLRQAVQGISDLITKTGKVNTDFADVETIMKGQGDALMGIGISSGQNRAKEAAVAAINNPMLEDTNIAGATKMLINIASTRKLPMMEIREAVDFIRSGADPDVNLIHGVFYEPDLEDKIRVTVIATGFRIHPEPDSKVKVEETNQEPDSTTVSITKFEEMINQATKDYIPGRNENLDLPPLYREKNNSGNQRRLF
jgi:cell division protein FtsZ